MFTLSKMVYNFLVLKKVIIKYFLIGAELTHIKKLCLAKTYETIDLVYYLFINWLK